MCDNISLIITALALVATVAGLVLLASSLLGLIGLVPIASVAAEAFCSMASVAGMVSTTLLVVKDLAGLDFNQIDSWISIANIVIAYGSYVVSVLISLAIAFGTYGTMDALNPDKTIENSTVGNQKVIDEMKKNEDIYKTVPGYDCSEIAEDLYNVSGKDGKIYVEQYGSADDFVYHTVYSDGTYIYDPRYNIMPVLKDVYFRMIEALNPNGFWVHEILP